MAFNFLSFCNNETDNSTQFKNRNTNREYSKIIELKEDEIENLKEELLSEQERCEKLSNSNDLLSKQIESQRSELTLYIEQNNEEHENQYEAAHLQQLLKDKQTQLNEISTNYKTLQNKLNKTNDEFDHSKLLLNREINSHQQLQIQLQDLNKKYLQIETQRNELLLTKSNTNENNYGIITKQLTEYQIQCKEKDDIISQFKLKDIEIKQQLNDEMKRADGMQDLLEKKSLENMRLKDEIELLKQQINEFNHKQNESLMDNAMEFRSRSAANIIEEILEPFNIPLEYFVKHLNDYKNDTTNLLLIWNKVDMDNNDEIIVSSENLNIIFKEFINLIKVIYIDEYIDLDSKYYLNNKLNVNILNENEIFKLKTDYQRGVLNREYILNKQMITKQMFLNGIFIDCIVNIEYKKDEKDEKDDDKKEKEFDMLEFITTSPTIIGMDMSDSEEYATKINDIIMNINTTENDKIRLIKIIDILIKCNDLQRYEIYEKLMDVFFINLNDKFNIYSKNKNVIRILNLMCKPLCLVSSEWIKKAINKKNEDDIILILFTQTNKQISNICIKYKELYNNNLYSDIQLAFNSRDNKFVEMCGALINLNKREEISPNNVNKKYANNDAKRLTEYISNEDKIWNICFELVVNRSWSHLNIILNTFEMQTRVSLIYSLNKLNPNKFASRKAVLTILNTSHSIHYYFANKLSYNIKNNNNNIIQYILLLRSQIDLGDINYEFTNNKQFGNGKTIKQWIEDLTQSSSYQYILLCLLGLQNDIQIKQQLNNRNINQKQNNNNNNNIPKKYINGLIKYNPSIIGQNINKFNASKDVNEICKWLKEYSGDKGILKERLANVLTSRNALQRGEIFNKYPNIINDISNKLKKGSVLELCDGMFKTSIASYNAHIIEKFILNNNINAIGDILCTNNNIEIKEIINEYKNLYYKADLIGKINELCEKNKRGSVRIILNSLLKCKRNENILLNIDKTLIENDINFLINTNKFKSEEKKRFVEIFCNNNWKYIREINRLYGMRSNNINLEKLIKTQLGSGSGHLTLTLLKYSCNPCQYFIQKLFELGNKFDKNKNEIARIFLNRSQIDLNQIRIQFAKHKQYGKQLDKWIQEKSKGSKFGYFLTQILTSIDRYNNNNNNVDNNNTIIVNHIDNNNNINVNENENGKKIINKPKYDDFNIHKEILNNDLKRKQSLNIFLSNGNGLIKFLKKHLRSKVVEKMWTKLDSKNKGYIEMNNFPDLIAFIVILYKVKIHQQQTKSKTKPEMDNRQIRNEIEHISIWIAKKYIYDKNKKFKLTLNDFQNKFMQWTQEYINVDGIFADF